jgi:RNA polymerase sigma factor (sigma-70 family)
MAERLQAVETEARFDAIVTEYRKFLRQSIARLCPKDLGIQFDDIEQEANLRLWRTLQSERKIDDLASYLYRIAATTTIDAIRRVKAKREEAFGLQDDEGEDREGLRIASSTTAAEESPQQLAERRELVARVEAVFTRLPDDRRRAVGLYLEGFTSQEIAHLLAWREPRARNLT